jgi:hypothetical protein
MVLREQGLRGGARAISTALELAKTYNSPEVKETVVGEALSVDDEAILEDFKAELLAETATPPSSPTHRRRRRAVRVQRRKLRDE